MKQGLFAAVLITAFLCCLAGLGNAASHDLVEPVAGGSINWTGRFVRAEGTAAWPPGQANTAAGWEAAVRMARQDAYISLLKAFKELRLTQRWRVGDVVADNDQILAKIEKLLSSAKTEEIVYSSDGRAEVIRRMPVAGPLFQLILPEYIVQLEMKSLGESSPNQGNEGFTGLVVDARGIDVKPAMCFDIFDESGREVYGPAYVSREFVVQKGMCGYVTDIAAVESNSRVGENPLIVKALEAKPPGGTDIVISNTDASRLRGTVENLFFLRKCRVIVVRRPFGQDKKAGP